MAARTALRVVTVNIWGKQGPWEQRRDVLRRQLAALEPDFVGFQEVVCFDATRGPVAPGTKSGDQAHELLEGTGLNVAFGAAIDLGFGFSFGNALASRFPLEAVETHRLPSDRKAEHRALVSAIARTSFGPVLFGVTHLAWRFDEGDLRMRQVLVVAREMERRKKDVEYPAILVGDFNSEPDSDEMRFLRGQHTEGGRATFFIDAYGEVGDLPGATYSKANMYARAACEPERRIDYVYVGGRDGRGWGRPHAAKVAFDRAEPAAKGQEAVHASDHFGVMADLDAPAFERRPWGNA